MNVNANCNDLITEAKDAALAHFVAERRLVLCIETMEDKTLAKLLVHHRKPLERDQDILEPFNYKTNSM